MKILRLLFSAVLIFVFIGCKKTEIANRGSLEVIKLKKSKTFDHVNPDFKDILYPAFQVDSKYEEYEKNRLREFKNIPQLDSFRIISRILDMDLYYLDLLKNKLISKEEFLENTKDVQIDSTLIAKNISNYRFNAIFGFKDNKKIIIPDLNNNFNFEDDPKMSFSSDSIYSFQDPKSIRTIASQNFKYQGLVNNKINWIERNIKVYPDDNSMYKYMIEESVKNKWDAKYTVMILFEDNWTGKQHTNKIPYHIVVYGGMVNKYEKILIKPDSIDHNFFSQDNFEFKLSDTVKVNSKYYVLDSIGSDFDNLYMSKLLIKELDKFGRRMGDKVQNYELVNLDGQKFELNTTEKKYRLLDFWGTWCKPCIELTPALKDLYDKNSEKLEIISIAADMKREDVQNYVSSNNLNWQHAYIYLKDYSIPIRKELKVFSFPTLILLDQNNRILIRGNSASFEKIQNYIKSN